MECQHLQTETINNFPTLNLTLCLLSLNRSNNNFEGSSVRVTLDTCIVCVCVLQAHCLFALQPPPHFLSVPVTQPEHRCQRKSRTISASVSHLLPTPLFSFRLLSISPPAIHNSPTSPSVSSDSASVSLQSPPCFPALQFFLDLVCWPFIFYKSFVSSMSISAHCHLSPT